MYTVHVPVFTHTCNGVYIMYIQCRYTLCTCVAACTCMLTVHHNNRCDSLIIHACIVYRMDRITIREREALEKEEEEREKENKKQEVLRKSESKRVRRRGG